MKRVREANINTVDYWDHRYAHEVAEMWRIWTTHDLIEKVARHIEPGVSVLDVGSGAGIIPKRIAQIRSDIRWSACDFSAEAVKYLQLLTGIHFHHCFQGDVLKGLPCGSRGFDTVLCTEVLEHLDSPEIAVRELVRIARSRVIVTVPNEDYINGPEHVWRFGRNSLIALLGPYGEVVVETCRHGRNLIGVCLLTK
jgi:2-polyprenyl-3-methyl-5-hydroxy-6-metoxy-1,4-benzoquinol methylase